MPQARTEEPVQYLSVEEAARVLRMNPHTLYRAIRRREVPHQPVGNSFRIPVAWLLGKPVAPSGAWVQEELPLVWGAYKPRRRVWRNTGLLVEPENM